MSKLLNLLLQNLELLVVTVLLTAFTLTFTLVFTFVLPLEPGPLLIGDFGDPLEGAAVDAGDDECLPMEDFGSPSEPLPADFLTFIFSIFLKGVCMTVLVEVS